MIIYIQQSKNINFFHKLLNIFKFTNIDGKKVLNLPINKNSKENKIKHALRKLCKYLKNNRINNIVLEDELIQNEYIINSLWNNNIKILDGTRLIKFFVCDIVDKIYEYKQKQIETGEITFLIKDNDYINTYNITEIAKKVKRLNIITNDVKKFEKIREDLYNEIGILIKITSNMNFNLSSSDIVINMDFLNDEIRKIKLPSNSIIINTQKNIKRFDGIIIQKCLINIPNNYKLNGFNDYIMYEAAMHKKTNIEIFQEIQNDNVSVKDLIGINGIINKKEFIKN